MNEINQLKRSMNISLPWERVVVAARNKNKNNFTLPTPIISLNLPKSATLTLYDYFKCGGYTAAHTFIPGTPLRIGNCMRDNYISKTPPFRGCNISNRTNEVIQFYSDVGITEPHCFYSSVHDGGLDHIARHYPNATILMMPRKFEDWYESVRNWGDGRLLTMWESNGCGGMATCTKRKNDDDDDDDDAQQPCWRDFYNAHTKKIREFAKDHPHLTYVELGLDASSPSVLEYYTGVSASCFQHCRPGRPKDFNVDLRTYKKCKPIIVSS